MLKRPEAHQESQGDKFSCTIFYVNLLDGAREAVVGETGSTVALRGHTSVLTLSQLGMSN